MGVGGEDRIGFREEVGGCFAVLASDGSGQHQVRMKRAVARAYLEWEGARFICPLR